MTKKYSLPETGLRVDVPCGSCRLCCQKFNVIMLLPEDGDDLTRFDYEIATIAPGLTGPILKHKPNGDCIYLGPHGCSIHDASPVVCQAFDCRGFYQKYTRRERRNMVRENKARQDIFDAGKARL